jgi:transcriptional regulator with XRE-family HTH domain
MPKSQGFDDPLEVERRREVGKRIVAARKAKGLLGYELADKVGVAPGTVSGWENGTHGLTQENLTRLAEVLKVNTSYVNPERLPNRQGIEWLSRQLGARLGKRAVEELLKLPEHRLRREIAAVIGSYALDESPAEHPARARK